MVLIASFESIQHDVLSVNYDPILSMDNNGMGIIL